MTNFGEKKLEKEKKIMEIYIFFILPMVAISQRSIPKDQLYENNTNKKETSRNTVLYLTQLKISSFLYFYSMYCDNISPHEQLLHLFPPLETSGES